MVSNICHVQAANGRQRAHKRSFSIFVKGLGIETRNYPVRAFLKHIDMTVRFLKALVKLYAGYVIVCQEF